LGALHSLNHRFIWFGGVVSGGTYLSLFNLQSMAMQVPEIGLVSRIGVMLAMCAVMVVSI